jgi:hypothetical protein
MSGALDLEVMGSVGTFSVTQTRSESSEKASNFSPGLRVQAIYGVTEQIGVLLGLRQHYLVDGGSLMGNTHTGLNLGASYYF